jgi:hypothetical protein
MRNTRDLNHMKYVELIHFKYRKKTNIMHVLNATKFRYIVNKTYLNYQNEFIIKHYVFSSAIEIKTNINSHFRYIADANVLTFIVSRFRKLFFSILHSVFHIKS